MNLRDKKCVNCRATGFVELRRSGVTGRHGRLLADAFFCRKCNYFWSAEDGFRRACYMARRRFIRGY